MRILVSTAPGGMADTLGRLLASHLTQTMGQQFYVENRGGAGNIIGIDLVAKSPPDGYTLLVCAGTITINHIMYKKLPYDVLRDLAPITQLVSLPNVLVVHPSQPFKTLADFIAAAKAKPGQVNYASAGVGSNLHLSMELLKARTGIDVVHVPYKGVGPAMSDLLGGHVASMVSNVASAKPHIDNGQAPRARRDVARTRARSCPTFRRWTKPGVKGYEVLELVRHVRAGGNAGADHRAHAGRVQGAAGDGRDEEAPRRRGRRADQQHAVGFHGLRQIRNSAMVRGRSRGEDPARGLGGAERYSAATLAPPPSEEAR